MARKANSPCTASHRQKHLIAAGLFLAMTPWLLAQTATGVIRGTVHYVTRAAIIDVHLRLIEDGRLCPNLYV
jgi:hypothetical protein